MNPSDSHPRVGHKAKWLVGGMVVLFVLFGATAFFWKSDARSGPAPLSQSQYLRHVVEPITIMESMSFDDGGSIGLYFMDSKGISYYVCLENTLEGNRNVIMGSFAPPDNRFGKVRISGVEERALLGLLQRWSHQDPDAKEIDRRAELYSRKEIDIDGFSDKLSGSQKLKVGAVSILRRLRARN